MDDREESQGGTPGGPGGPDPGPSHDEATVREEEDCDEQERRWLGKAGSCS